MNMNTTTHTTVAKASRIIGLLLVFCMCICLFSDQNVYAYTNTQLRQKTAITEITSGDKSVGDYVKLSTSGSSIDVTFKHDQSFDQIVLRLMQGGSTKSSKYFYDSSGTFQESFNFSRIPNGNYYFKIIVQKNANMASGLTNYPTYLQGVYVSVNAGKPTMYNFKNVTKSNKSRTGSGSSKYYTTKSLSDLKYQLLSKRGKKSTPRSISTTKETKYYNKISDQVLDDAGVSNSSKYAQMKALFSYVADNFYYDNQATASKRVAYDDPYYNLLYLNNKTGNNYNAYAGKVAIHCDGYAGALLALGRSQNIPCRLIYGRKIITSTNWANCPSSYFSSNSHTWVQAWIDGRWVNMDPQQGSLNTYGTKSSSSNKTWRKSSIINLTYFDISHDLLSYTHYARTIAKGSK